MRSFNVFVATVAGRAIIQVDSSALDLGPAKPELDGAAPVVVHMPSNIKIASKPTIVHVTGVDE